MMVVMEWASIAFNMDFSVVTTKTTTANSVRSVTNFLGPLMICDSGYATATMICVVLSNCNYLNGARVGRRYVNVCLHPFTPPKLPKMSKLC